MTTDHNHSHSHGHSCEHSKEKEHSPKGQHNDNLQDRKALADKEQRNEVLRKLKLATALCFTFFIIEVIGGLLAHSLAVLSDAAHLAADLSAFIVAIVGSHIASQPANQKHSFGLKRTESLAALFSMVSLVILSIGLVVEASRRMWMILYLGESEPVDGKLMSTIAGIGVFVNIALAGVLGVENHVHLPGEDHGHAHDHGSHGECEKDEGHSHAHAHHDEEKAPLKNDKNASAYSATEGTQHVDDVAPKKKERNVNLHAAYLHVLADLAQSVIVFIAGLIIWWKPTWQIVDPICTLIFSVLVCFSTFGVIRASLAVLLEAVPSSVKWSEIYDSISNVDGVSNVHDLHIWSISQGDNALSVHATAERPEQAYGAIKKICNSKGIPHLTLQLTTAEECVTCDGVGCVQPQSGE